MTSTTRILLSVLVAASFTLASLPANAFFGMMGGMLGAMFGGWGWGGWGWGGWGYPYYGWGYPYYGWGYPYYGAWGYPYQGWAYPYAAYPVHTAPAVAVPPASTPEK